MKTKIFAILAAACLSALSLWASVDNTARACRRNINTWEGRTVTLDVVFLNPIDAKGSLPDNAMLALAYTWDDRNLSFGGVIPVLFQKTEGDRALKRYGITGDFNGTVRSRSLRGTLTRILREGRSNLIYLDCSNSGPYADAIKPALAQVLDSIPEDVADPMQPITPVGPSGGGGGGAVVVVPPSTPPIIVNTGDGLYVPAPTSPVIIVRTNQKPKTGTPSSTASGTAAGTATASAATTSGTATASSATRTGSGLVIQSGGSSVILTK